MPDAITATNGLVSISILFAIGWASVRASRAAWPLVKAHAEARTKKIEADALLSDSVRVNHDKLTGLVGRSIEMQSANTAALGSQGELLARVVDRTEKADQHLEKVYHHLLKSCDCGALSEGTQPA